MSVAKQGYLEIRNSENQTVFQSHCLSKKEVKTVQKYISTGIIAEAIKSGEPISTSTAFLDPRFDSMESVQLANIEAVMCAPFKGAEAQGVIYLQGDSKFRPNSKKVKLDAALFTDHIIPLLDQILLQYEQRISRDPTYVLRKKFRLQGILGSSQVIYEVLKTATTIAPLEVNVLLTGESGTGKTQIAHAIHVNSRRSRHPFVELNCGAFQDTLIESELFGTVRGAFNDAQNKPGKIVAAGEGTLFLDEIGELSQSAQVKLLQFLQSGEFYPVGSDKKAQSRARIICATNKYLEELVHQRKFREDLYFRIKTFPIHIPPLRARKEDIGQLAEHFCQMYCIKHSFRVLTLSPELMKYLEAQRWTGNIRELENLIESACIRAMIEESAVVDVQHALHTRSLSQNESTKFKYMDDFNLGTGFHEATKSFQRKFLINSLDNFDWNVKATAEQLGLSKSHMYNLMTSLDLRMNKEM